MRPETWPDFAALVEANNGVWGGCWCMGFHAKGEGWGKSADLNRAEKLALVQEDRAHAALVYDGGVVERYPDDVAGAKTSASFLHNGTLAMFEQQGFERTHQIGKTRWVVRKRCRPARRPT